MTRRTFPPPTAPTPPRRVWLWVILSIGSAVALAAILGGLFLAMGAG